MAKSKKTPARKTRGGAAAKKAPASKWSQHVTETSDAMDLKHDVFKSDSPADIARSLKSSAEHSDRRKAEPFRSAMSMLTFYINRAGHNLEPAQHRTLEKAKEVLRELFGRVDDAPKTARKAASKKVASKKAASKKAVSKRATVRKSAKSP